MGNLLVAWSARLAIAAWAVRWLHDLHRPGQSPPRWLSLVWTMGGVTNLLHVLVAFHYAHAWDAAAAWEHVARQTAAVTGWHWGGGLYVNYVFSLLWLADVGVCWRACVLRRPLPPTYLVILHGLFVFMIFNATVVFGPPVWKWVFPVFAVLSLAVWLIRRRTSRTPGPEPEPSGSVPPR
ncbi:MAG: hypothetical protein ACF8PG_03245 [Maioricimonas sp. JB045]